MEPLLLKSLNDCGGTYIEGECDFMDTCDGFTAHNLGSKNAGKDVV